MRVNCIHVQLSGLANDADSAAAFDAVYSATLGPTAGHAAIPATAAGNAWANPHADAVDDAAGR